MRCRAALGTIEVVMSKWLVPAAAAFALIAAPAWSQGQPAPAVAPPVAGAPAVGVVKAAEFIKTAALSDWFEIQSGRLAIEKAQGAEVKDFARHMVEDHTKSSEKLKAAAGNVPIPAELDEKHAALMRQLQTASGAEFDRIYLGMQKNAHAEAVSLFEQYSKAGDDAKLKQFAQETLPVIKRHWERVQRLAKS